MNIIIDYAFVVKHNSTVEEVNFDLDTLRHPQFCKKYNLPVDSELEIEIPEEDDEYNVIDIMGAHLINDKKEFVNLNDGYFIVREDFNNNEADSK